jgi:hypothetical protein
MSAFLLIWHCLIMTRIPSRPNRQLSRLSHASYWILMTDNELYSNKVLGAHSRKRVSIDFGMSNYDTHTVQTYTSNCHDVLTRAYWMLMYVRIRSHLSRMVAVRMEYILIKCYRPIGVSAFLLILALSYYDTHTVQTYTSNCHDALARAIIGY